MTSSTPEAPEPGTQVELEAKIHSILNRYITHLHDVDDATDYVMEAISQSPTVALTNDRDEEETR